MPLLPRPPVLGFVVADGEDGGAAAVGINAQQPCQALPIAGDATHATLQGDELGTLAKQVTQHSVAGEFASAFSEMRQGRDQGRVATVAR